MHDWQKNTIKNIKPEEYAIVSVVGSTFLNYENDTQGESHNFMKSVVHLPNLCV